MLSDVAESTDPIGLFVARMSRTVSRAFEAVLGDAGGSLASWLVLVSLKAGLHQSQREIADELGIEGATLTHHLNRMEAAGLVTRSRNPSNRRVHDVSMTAEGERVFLTLVGVVHDFDRQLRDGFSERELATLRRLLRRLADNATAPRDEPEEER